MLQLHTCNILWLFGIFCDHVLVNFPFLICSTKQNLATKCVQFGNFKFKNIFLNSPTFQATNELQFANSSFFKKTAFGRLPLGLFAYINR
jgi:hypothetical protein